MTTHPVARLNDTVDHGGEIIEGSETTSVNGRKVARVGDKVLCDIHGQVTITTGSPNFEVDGKRVARVTSECSCGAKIITGSPDTECA